MRFDSYHPTINFIYFTAVIVCTVCFNHPVFLATSYAAAFAYSVKLNGIRGLIFDLCLIPCALVYAGIYSYYNHFGITNLRQNIIGNQITLEAVAVGLVIGVSAAAVIMWMSCVFTIISADKVVYLFGRISPKLSLFLSIVLRMIPRIKQRAKRINVSRTSIGRGAAQGNIFSRAVNSLKIVSMIITWILETLVESAQSMKSRGYSLKGRTAFSVYRFNNRDRSFVVVIFLCMTFIMIAVLLDQTNIHYDPQIIINRITLMSFVFYAAYALLLFLPIGIQLTYEKKFKRLSQKQQKYKPELYILP